MPGIALNKGQVVRDIQRLGSIFSTFLIYRTDVYTSTMYMIFLRPATRHFPLAAGQVKHSVTWIQLANFAQQHQLIFGEWIQDTMISLCDLVETTPQLYSFHFFVDLCDDYFLLS